LHAIFQPISATVEASNPVASALGELACPVWNKKKHLLWHICQLISDAI